MLRLCGDDMAFPGLVEPGDTLEGGIKGRGTITAGTGQYTVPLCQYTVKYGNTNQQNWFKEGTSFLCVN